MAESSKVCPKCKETLPVSSFQKDKYKKDGKWYQCTSCKMPGDRARGKKYRDNLKEKVYDHYGRTCVCCGEIEMIFLTLDHINNDGAAHRRKIIGNNRRDGACGPQTYRWIIKNNFPNSFQVLCLNCNWAKSRGGCPHQKTSKLAATQS